MKRLFIRAALLAVFATGVIDSAQADLSISKKRTHDVSCSGGVCTATAKNANLNVTDLTNMLAAGDTTVKFGSGALAIQMLDGFPWTNTSRLTLDANTSLGFHKPVTVAGQGALTITYNDGGADGDLKFIDKGKIDFWDASSSLKINDSTYILVENLATLANDLNGNNGNGQYALAHDYDASSDGVYGAAPITRLYGVIEGLGNSFRNVTIHSTYSGGLIAVVFGGSVRDLDLSNIDVEFDTDGDTGAIASDLKSGTIVGCSVSGFVKGGLGNTPNTGGLLGYMDNALIDRSRSSANLVSGSWVGGLVGFLNSGTISRSFAMGTITGGKQPAVGGLVGSSNGDVVNSYAAANVLLDGHKRKLPELGGLVGENRRGNISTSYSRGAIKDYPPYSEVGGLIGADRAGSGHVQASYWDLDTSGITDPSQGAGYPANDPGITGLSDAQLKSSLPERFDPKIWGQSPNINNGYPYLLANPPQK
jgi:hypothetical protein